MTSILDTWATILDRATNWTGAAFTNPYVLAAVLLAAVVITVAVVLTVLDNDRTARIRRRITNLIRKGPA